MLTAGAGVTVKSGYLYVLTHPSDPELFKVGVTILRPEVRLAQHNTQLDKAAGKVVKETGREVGAEDRHRGARCVLGREGVLGSDALAKDFRDPGRRGAAHEVGACAASLGGGREGRRPTARARAPGEEQRMAAKAAAGQRDHADSSVPRTDYAGGVPVREGPRVHRVTGPPRAPQVVPVLCGLGHPMGLPQRGEGKSPVASTFCDPDISAALLVSITRLRGEIRPTRWPRTLQDSSRCGSQKHKASSHQSVATERRRFCFSLQRLPQPRRAYSLANSLSLASSCVPFTSSSRDPRSGAMSGSSRNRGAKSDVVVRNPLDTFGSAATTPKRARTS